MKVEILELTVVAAIVVAGVFCLVEDTRNELEDQKQMTENIIQRINHHK